MMRFNGKRWELFGPILEDAGAAGALSVLIESESSYSFLF
jgi:hypothetical protein